MVDSTDGNIVTEGKGRTTTIAIAGGKLLPCIATRVKQRHTSGPHDVPLPVDRLAVEAGLLLWLLFASCMICTSGSFVLCFINDIPGTWYDGVCESYLHTRPHTR